MTENAAETDKIFVELAEEIRPKLSDLERRLESAKEYL